MSRTIRGMVALGVVVPVLLAAHGCCYLKARGNDAKDMFDIGLTFTKTPHVAVHAGFQSLLTVGYADLDGHLAGIGQGQAGWVPMRYKAAGAVLDGYEQYAYGANFDPAAAASPRQRGAGLGMLHYELPDSAMEMLQCPKFVHLGWVGVDVNCKLGEILDFLAGWSTLDIGGDDDRAMANP